MASPVMVSDPAIFGAKKELGFAPCSSPSIIGRRLPRRASNKVLAVVAPARSSGAPSASGPVKHAMTMTEKILARASEKSHLEPGENVWANVDVLMTHDVSGPGTIGIFKKEFGQDAQANDF